MIINDILFNLLVSIYSVIILVLVSSLATARNSAGWGGGGVLKSTSDPEVRGHFCG